MEPYSFGQDFFATFRSSPDAIKALWLIVPPIFAFAIARAASKMHGKVPAKEITLANIQEAKPTGPRSGEHVLVFARGRLLHKFEVSGPNDELGP